MSDLLDIIKGRRSIRKYQEKEVPDQAIAQMLEAARWAPSAANNQPWRFVVLKDPQLKEEVVRTFQGLAAINSFVKSAPLIFLIYVESSHRWVELDCGMACQNLMLEAHSLGLGTCFIGAYNEKALKNVLGLSERARIIGLITCGFPDEQPSPKTRHPLEEIAFFGRGSYKTPKSSFLKKMELSLANLFFKKKRNNM